jgi:hypothetical protein
MKKVRKNNKHCQRLSFSTAVVNANRKGGQRFRPVRIPNMTGNRYLYLVPILFFRAFVDLAAQCGSLFPNPYNSNNTAKAI